MHRVSEAMRIASLVVSFFPPRRNRGEKSPNKTRRLRIVRPVAFNGACTMRVHERRRVHPMHPPYGTLACAQRVAFSLALPPFLFLVRFVIYSRRPSSRLILNPFVRPPATKRLRTGRGAQLRVADRDVSVPLQVVNETDLPLGLPMLPPMVAIVVRAVIVSTANNNIWVTPPPLKSQMEKGNRGKGRGGGEVRFRLLSRLFSGKRGSYV